MNQNNVNKKTLLVVGYHFLADGFRTCANFLEKDYFVLFFPLMSYQKQKLDIVNDLSKYINGEKLENYISGLTYHNSPVDIVFFWYHNYFCDNYENLQQFHQIKKNVKNETLFIGYNWDPLCPTQKIKPSKIQLISDLDVYISGDISEIRHLNNKGLHNIEHCASGFDPKISQFTKDYEYQCDVSIICTNLYSDEQQFPEKYSRINRKKLIDLIYENRQTIKFHIYGPDFLSHIYPECYRGYIKYIDCPKVFSNSKINLCIHAVTYNNSDTHIYFSERLPQILGCHGLLYCGTEYSHLLHPNINYILTDINDPIGQIQNILKNYRSYLKIKHKGYILAKNHFTWQKLLEKINKIQQQKNHHMQSSTINHIL